MHVAENSRTPKSIRVLIVDDSSMTRFLMQEILETDPLIEVVGLAPDAMEARKLIKRLKPEVITLDVEMPGMNGIDFLRNLMRLRPMPVVMVSSFTERGADITFRALEIGAVDFVTKPRVALDADALASYSKELATKVKVASAAHLSALTGRQSSARSTTGRTPDEPPPDRQYGKAKRIVAIGASTGGTEAICSLLQQMPGNDCGIVIVQHIPDSFNAAFAQRLNKKVGINVGNARHGETIRRNCAYVAPAGTHLAIRKSGSGYECVLSDEEAVGFHRPSVDVLFDSVGREAGSDAVGIILTGMGKDGAEGLATMRKAGAYTIAQDEDSSIVWGMPGEAVKKGGAADVASLDAIADLVRQRLAQN
jgi:two-component system chemotaxis response regulator CheB